MDASSFGTKLKKWMKLLVPLFIILIIVLGSVGTIGVGKRGIHLRFSGATGKVFGEGVYFKVPLIDSVVVMDVKIQKEAMSADAASKDLQTVQSSVALNYHVNPSTASQLYQSVGTDYTSRLIDPLLQETVKAVTARFTAEELITKREDAREQIKSLLKAKLEPHGILVDEFNIVNFNFSKSFNDAIEAKVTAEQNALAAKNKLEQIKFEAEQRVTTARGEAEAIKIQAQAIQQQGGESYVNLKAVEKWDGSLPTYMMGNSVPFINLTK